MRKCLDHIVLALVIGCAIAAGRVQAERLTLGALVPLTGEFAPIGKEIVRGIELAIAKHQSSMSLVVQDIKSLEPSETVRAAHYLLKVAGVKIVFCCFIDDMEPIASIFNQAKVPLVALWDSTDKIQRLGSFMFSTGFSTERAGTLAARYATTSLNTRRVVIIKHQTPWSLIISSSFRSEFVARGGTITYEIELPLSTLDYRSVVPLIQSKTPDIIYAPLAWNMSLLLRALTESGYPGVIMSGDGMILSDTFDRSVPSHGVFYTAPYSNLESSLLERYVSLYGERPVSSQWMNIGYVGSALIVNSIIDSALQLGTNGVEIQPLLLRLFHGKQTADRDSSLFKVVGTERVFVENLSPALQ